MNHAPLTFGLSRAFLSLPVTVALAGMTGLFLTRPVAEENPTGGTQLEAGLTLDGNRDFVTPGPDSASQATATFGSGTQHVSDTDGRKPVENSREVEVARITRLLAGTWSRESYGTRSLTIREDGTATMVIRPSTVYALVFGEQIDVEVQWELQDGCVDYKVTSATPSDKFELARSTWGDHWHEKIDRLDEKTLILLGEDGDKYEWTRMTVKPESVKDR